MRRILRALVFGMLPCHVLLAALPSTTQWEVRTAGSDSNAGCFDSAGTGTDFSQQDAAQVSYTDLVIGGTNTQFTSAAHPFSAVSVGNCINVTAGSGFTTGRYVVLSVAGSTATMDRAVGTASSTGGTGVLGGGLLTVAAALSPMTASNTVNIKAGTYTVTSGLTTAVTTFSLIGYQTTHNDGGTKPLITTATNSVDLFTITGCSGTQVFSNISFSHTATTRGNGILQTSCHSTGTWVFVNDILDGFTTALNSDNAGAHFDVTNVILSGTEIKNSTIAGNGFLNNVYVIGSYIHANGTGLEGGNLSQNLVVLNSVIAGQTVGRGIDFGGNVSIFIVGNVFYGNVGTACNCTNGGAQYIQYYNNIFYGNSGIASNFNGGAQALLIYQRANQANAFGANGSTGWQSGSNPIITLTANPFTNAASGDFSLNNTAGGGALLRALGYPTSYGGTTTSNLSLGVVQSGSSSGGGGSYTFVQ